MLALVLALAPNPEPDVFVEGEIAVANTASHKEAQKAQSQAR